MQVGLYVSTLRFVFLLMFSSPENIRAAIYDYVAKVLGLAQ
jgi:hypothetical protein